MIIGKVEVVCNLIDVMVDLGFKDGLYLGASLYIENYGNTTIDHLSECGKFCIVRTPKQLTRLECDTLAGRAVTALSSLP